MNCAAEYCRLIVVDHPLCERHRRHPECVKPGCSAEARPFHIHCQEHAHDLKPCGRCSWPACTWAALADGLCPDHYRLTLIANNPRRPRCDECDQAALFGDLCQQHHAEMLGRPLLPSPDLFPSSNPVKARTVQRAKAKRRKRKATQCTADGCDQLSAARSLCLKHYELALRLDPSRPRCAERGCGQASRKRGLCAAHYRIDRLNDPTRVRCAVDGCTEAMMSKGLCERHARAEATGRLVRVAA